MMKFKKNLWTHDQKIDLQEQIRKYQRILQKDPTSNIFAPLAEAYRKEGNIPMALAIAQKGIDHNPHFIGGKMTLGRILLDLKDYFGVLELLNPIVHEHQDNIAVHRILAEAYYHTQQHKKAAAHFQHILQLFPEDQQSLYCLGVIEKIIASEHSDNAYKKNLSIQERDRMIQKILKLQGVLIQIERYKMKRKQPQSTEHHSQRQLG